MSGILQALARIFRFFGILAALNAWIFISISVNPWFDLFRDALSDLGASQANSPWIYNIGLITSGFLLLPYSAYLIYDSRDKLEIVGGGYVAIGGLFLSLIGFFPGGTRPHVFVSTYFFVQMGLAILLMGLGALKEGRAFYGTISVLTFIFMLVGSTFDWPSVATLEVYEVILLDIWVLTRTFYCRR